MFFIFIAMSSLRNAVFRREHLERSQPQARKKYGLLEKHKDYVKRARNFNEKEKRITALKFKAALRNPDEFYFNMANASVKVGSFSSFLS
jgi:U3 small nucleolar RNA-associated protein 11